MSLESSRAASHPRGAKGRHRAEGVGWVQALQLVSWEYPRSPLLSLGFLTCNNTDRVGPRIKCKNGSGYYWQDEARVSCGRAAFSIVSYFTPGIQNESSTCSISTASHDYGLCISRGLSGWGHPGDGQFPTSTTFTEGCRVRTFTLTHVIIPWPARFLHNPCS